MSMIIRCEGNGGTETSRKMELINGTVSDRVSESE